MILEKGEVKMLTEVLVCFCMVNFAYIMVKLTDGQSIEDAIRARADADLINGYFDNAGYHAI